MSHGPVQSHSFLRGRALNLVEQMCQAVALGHAGGFDRVTVSLGPMAPKNRRPAPNTTGTTFITTWSIRPKCSVGLEGGPVDGCGQTR